MSILWLDATARIPMVNFTFKRFIVSLFVSKLFIFWGLLIVCFEFISCFLWQYIFYYHHLDNFGPLLSFLSTTYHVVRKYRVETLQATHVFWLGKREAKAKLVLYGFCLWTQLQYYHQLSANKKKLLIKFHLKLKIYIFVQFDNLNFEYKNINKIMW